jgi:hypothetical protein
MAVWVMCMEVVDRRSTDGRVPELDPNFTT